MTRTEAERAVIEAAKAWMRAPVGRGSADTRLAAEEELTEALEALVAAPKPTAAEEAETVRRKLADPEVRKAVASAKIAELMAYKSSFPRSAFAGVHAKYLSVLGALVKEDRNDG